MICSGCGHELQPEWNACPSCGTVREALPGAATAPLSTSDPDATKPLDATKPFDATMPLDATVPLEATAPVVARRIRRPHILGAIAAVLLLVVAGVYFGRGSSKPSALATIDSTSTPSSSSGATVPQTTVSTSGSPAAGADLTRTATPTAVVAPRPPSGPAPIRLDGTGRSTTQLFNVVGGLTVFRGHCTCIGSFTVELFDQAGASQGVLFSGTGKTDASVGKDVEAGSYWLKIDADHRWTVGVSQPRNMAGVAIPHTFFGRGQMYVGPFDAGSTVRLDAQNTGTSSFVVQVLSVDGEVRDVAFNKSGNFSGSTVAKDLFGGPYYLNVDSDGTWSIVVRQP